MAWRRYPPEFRRRVVALVEAGRKVSAMAVLALEPEPVSAALGRVRAYPGSPNPQIFRGITAAARAAGLAGAAR